MKTLVRGDIVDFVPSFRAYLREDKTLVLSEKGDFLLTVDTGFSGGIALPLEIIEKMGLNLVDFDTFRIATGEVVELPVFLGKIIIAKHEVETWFIPGDSLLGMEFLSSVSSILSLNFEDKIVKLTR